MSFVVPIISVAMLDDRRPKPVSCRAGCLLPAARPGLILDSPAARKKARLYRELGIVWRVIRDSWNQLRLNCVVITEELEEFSSRRSQALRGSNDQ